MERLAGHHLTVMVLGLKRRDELGAMARAVQVFKDAMLRTKQLTAEQEPSKQAAASVQKAAMNGTADAFEAKVSGLVSVLSSAATELQATAQCMSATHTNQQATTFTSAALEASSGVQTVAAAAEQLSASIGEISRQVAQSARITGNAVNDARRTDAIVRTLAEAAHKIGTVVELISGIAGQTNLLALNATAECDDRRRAPAMPARVSRWSRPR